MAIQPERPAGSSHMMIFNGAITVGTGNAELQGSNVYFLFADATAPNDLDRRFPRGMFDDSFPRFNAPHPVVKDRTWAQNLWVHPVPLNPLTALNCIDVGTDPNAPLFADYEVVDQTVANTLFPSAIGLFIPVFKLRMVFSNPALPGGTDFRVTFEIRHTMTR